MCILGALDLFAQSITLVHMQGGVSGFIQEDVAGRRVAVWPLVYSEAGNGFNDRVMQACSINAAGECVFRPVAYASATPCEFGLAKRAVTAYFA